MLLLVIQMACAQAPVASPTPEIPKTLQQTEAQRARAQAMQDLAEQHYAADQTTCYKKFQVNSCLDEARKRYTDSVISARNIDIPARKFQREARRTDVAAKEEKRATDLIHRSAEQKTQAETYRKKEAEKKTNRERKAAEISKKAVEGRKKPLPNRKGRP